MIFLELDSYELALYAEQNIFSVSWTANGFGTSMEFLFFSE